MSFVPTSRTLPHPVLSASSDGGPTPAAPSGANEFVISRSQQSPSEQLDSHLSSAIADLSPAKATPMTAPAPGSFAASLRAMMDEARAGVAQARVDGISKVAEAVNELNAAKVATAQVAGSLAKTIADEAAAVMSELGQISNLPPE